MAIPPASVIDAINSSVTHIECRVEIFEADGTTRFNSGNDDDRLISGSVSVDYSRDERRSLECVLDNSDLGLVNAPSGIWYDKVFKPYYRVLLTGGAYYDFQLGEFVVDQISEPHFPNVMNISLRDYTKKCKTSKYAMTTAYSVGQELEEIVHTVASNAGITKFLLPVTGITVGKAFQFERGTERWEAIRQIVMAYDHDAYFDEAGYLVLAPYQDPVTSPVVATFKTGSDGNLASYDKSTNDGRLYNHIVVTGDTSDSSVIPVSAEATNTEPSSPTRIAKIGDRVYEYVSSFITTEEQAQAVADSFLRIHALEEYNLNFGAIAYPWLDAGYITIFEDPVTLESIRMLLSSISIPLSPGTMTGTGKRVRLVG